MGERVLITGGAGFVGSHLADTLAEAGHDVVLFDNLEPQVHGSSEERPSYLSPDHRLIRGDVRDADAIGALVSDVDVVFHLAAMVGVGQSMYQVRRYTEVNTMGMATLVESLVAARGRVRKLLVASSMSVYGEGAYRCSVCGLVYPRLRPSEQLDAADWDVHCPTCGAAVEPVPTYEDKPLYPSSIYAINKRDHEEMALAFGQAYAVPAVALRFFNIYGSRQALSNPYTGVAAIFCGRMLTGETPVIYEDGRQMRDFVHVTDIVRALLLAMDSPAADGQVLNVGSGQPVSILEVATLLARELGWSGEFEIRQQFRAGDIRHCFADISRIRSLLGYSPRKSLAEGVPELVAWVANQRGLAVPSSAQADRELERYGLLR